jgi:hypothetical protein
MRKLERSKSYVHQHHEHPSLANQAGLLVLYSSKAITKEATEVAARFGRASPDPRLGPVVELLGRHLHCSFNLRCVRKALTCKRITTEEAPPPLLEIEPTCSFGDEHMLEARMFREPGTGLQTVMAAQIVGDDENIASRVVGLNVLEQFNIVLGIARSGTVRDFLAITHPQRPIDPYLVVTTTVLQRSLDAMSIG